MTFEPRSVLMAYGGRDDAEIDLFNAAMAFAVSMHPGIDSGRYFHHAQKLIRDTGERHAALIAAGARDDAGARLAALKHILSDREQYIGDDQTYDDLQNADMIRVIDRRKGMPIALAVLYLHVGRAQGWQVHGLNFPGHFLCRMDYGAERIIFDPFSACAVMDAAGLRALVKQVRGPAAELSVDYYQPCTNRDILIRLQNNIKLRLIAAEDYLPALESIEMMLLIHPAEYRLLFDAGVLYAKTEQDARAVEVLEKYLAAADSAQDRHDAALILRDLRDRE